MVFHEILQRFRELFNLAYDKENRFTAISGSASARYVYDGDGRDLCTPERSERGKRVLAVENGVRTVYIGDYFEAELGSATTFPVFVPDLDNTGLPNKFYLPIVKNGAGTGTLPPVNPGNGFFVTHPIRPNQSAITWRMYYTAGQRVAMRISHGPTTSPYPAPGATQDEVYYLLGDHLGSTTVTVNQDGSIKAKVRYDAWGKTRYTSGTTPTDRKYTGQIEEATVGLYFYNARWYDRRWEDSFRRIPSFRSRAVPWRGIGIPTQIPIQFDTLTQPGIVLMVLPRPFALQWQRERLPVMPFKSARIAPRARIGLKHLLQISMLKKF